MPFDLGAGLSEMGKSVAETAGTAAINAQKADLDKQKDILADQLATTRETNLEQLRQSGEIANTKLQQQGAKDLVGVQKDASIAINDASTKNQIDAHIQEATADTKEAVSKVKALSTPDMLAAQHAIAAASEIPNVSLTTQSDGTAATFNPKSGKITPILGTDGQPIKLQNPDVAKAVVEQTVALRATGTDLDRMMKSDLDAARVLHKDDAPEDQQKVIDDIHSYYRPKLEAVQSQLMSLTSALGVRSGIDLSPKGPPAGAPPLSAFVKKPAPAASTGGFMNGATP